MKAMKFETRAIHEGEKPLSNTGKFGDVSMPIHLSSTFARLKTNEPTEGFEYSRTGNPTRRSLEAKLATVESTKFGLAFSSGLAAETTLLISLLKTGNTIVASDDLYGGTRRLFNNFAQNFSLHVEFRDLTNLGNISVSLRKEKPAIIWLETPSNPLLKIIDLKAIADLSKQSGSIMVVDNTFASPYFQNPAKFGADIVLHSTTKYINGHSDSVGGAVMTSNEEIFSKVHFYQNASGAILSPFDSYLTLRGLKTLHARMAIHEKNAMKAAAYLSDHKKVKRTYYPGLKDHPDHELARKQMTGFSGMLSINLDADHAGVSRFLEGLELFSLAESLGGVESLIEVPALMTHSSIPPVERSSLGIPDSLVRLSIGIENADDLIEDLERGLKRI